MEKRQNIQPFLQIPISSSHKSFSIFKYLPQTSPKMPILSPQPRVLPNIAAVLSALPIFIGINGLLRPKEVLLSVGFPAPTTPDAQRLANALTRHMAARNIAAGLISLAVWYSGNRKLHALTMISLSFYPFVDALISQDLIGGGLWNHLPVAFLSLGLGVGMSGWLG
jgi:Domain of unknown function (DUF4267)